MLNIAIVTNSASGGGAEKAMNILANKLHIHGIKVSILAINKSSFDLSQINCDLYQIGRDRNDGVLRTLYSWIKFKNLIVKLKPDLLILNCDLPEFFAALLPIRVKMIAVEHSQFPWNTRKKIGRAIRTILRCRNVTWVAVSDHVSIWPNSSKPFRIIYNAIADLEHTSLVTLNSIDRLVFIGRLHSEQKNPQMIIRIAKLVNLPVLVLGDGDAKEEMIELANINRVEITFVGFVEKPWELIGNGDLLIVPSRNEGDGLVVVEALQRNIPLIISNIQEFIRFGLPCHNYACNEVEYSNLILKNTSNLSKFRVDSDISSKVLSNRRIEKICDYWLKLISDTLKIDSLL